MHTTLRNPSNACLNVKTRNRPCRLDESFPRPSKRRPRYSVHNDTTTSIADGSFLIRPHHYQSKSTLTSTSTSTLQTIFSLATSLNNMTVLLIIISILVPDTNTLSVVSVGSDRFGQKRQCLSQRNNNNNNNHNKIARRKSGIPLQSQLFESNDREIDDHSYQYYFDPFPSMMNKFNRQRSNNTSSSINVIVDSTSPGFVPTNGISDKINGYSSYNRINNNNTNTNQNEYFTSSDHGNDASHQSSQHHQQQEQSQTAPEVSNWTSIMKSGLFFRKKKKIETVDGIYKELRDMSQYDVEQVDGYWEKLLPVVSYLGTEKVVKVYDALRVAYRAHRGQARKSGEPFIIHPVEVSLLLAGLKMDEYTVMAGLLHDTVEDTDMTFELIEEMFGQTVRAIVEGETKVSKLPKLAFSDYADEQAENLRQMFVAMTDDYRIIIVKLADRLHNMRTLKFMKPEKQVKISRETLDIFAPLAHRMGIWQFKSELEDTAFMYLYPQEYKRLSRRLQQHQKKFQDTLDKSQQLLKQRLNADPTLREQTTNVQVSGRMKEIYSLWHKMETKKERNLDNILDVIALRVIITPKVNPDDHDDENESDRGVWLCYHVLGLVQHLEGFQPVPTRVKDYISFPKPNGYQSLHTALILNGQKIEVQIRTSMMHQVAEYGMASHWAYTDGKRRQSEEDDLYNTPWLSSIKEWQNEKLNARDFVDSVRSELLGKRVFVFLRNGKILNLARGATAIDAAFQIHTEVGLNMHGVEINGKPVPISYELQNGDVVSILTGEGRPSTDWMRYAKSRSTRSRLRSYFRSQQKHRYVLRQISCEQKPRAFRYFSLSLSQSTSFLPQLVGSRKDFADGLPLDARSAYRKIFIP
jgi:GTP pyrophosphokinase